MKFKALIPIIIILCRLKCVSIKSEIKAFFQAIKAKMTFFVLL